MTRKQTLAAFLTAICGTAATATTVLAHDASEGGQSIIPPKQIEMYLDGYHCYKSEANLLPPKQKQVRVAHYCSHYSPDLIMCAVYDSNKKDARLIGIEYVVPGKVYDALPAGEKKYWHPHDGEVSGGLLTMPGLPADKEKSLLNFVSTTWGKTWNLWQPGDKLPYGEPKLMWPIKASHLAESTKESIEQRKKDPTF